MLLTNNLKRGFLCLVYGPVREMIFMTLLIGIENSKRVKWDLTPNTLKY